jgi:hypothetical protein
MRATSKTYYTPQRKPSSLDSLRSEFQDAFSAWYKSKLEQPDRDDVDAELRLLAAAKAWQKYHEEVEAWDAASADALAQ